MSKTSVFDTEIELPASQLTEREKTLLGFERRYERIQNQLRLVLNQDQLSTWSSTHHNTVLPICNLVADQYPLVSFMVMLVQGKLLLPSASQIVSFMNLVLRILYYLSSVIVFVDLVKLVKWGHY